MDKKLLLQEEVQAFIKAHERDDLPSLLLQKKNTGLPIQEIAQQIKGRRKAEKKLPLWYGTMGILYPPAPSLEQSSSEIAAKFKSNLFSGNTSLDLTGGFGVDSIYLAKQFRSHTYVEAGEQLAEVAEHNFKVLNQSNIAVHNTSAEGFLANNKRHFDLIYIDPDRRPIGNRIIGFNESKPNILALVPSLFNTADRIMVKASPMLDITLAIKQLTGVYQVIVLAIENEVKELLFLMDKSAGESITYRCINITKTSQQIFEYEDFEQQQAVCLLHKPLQYLYEPNAAIIKAGVYELLCHRFDFEKIARNTHLYTADKVIQHFPGRKFKIISNVAYNKKQVLPFLPTKKANVTTRNFPDTPDQVKKKLNIKDGGDTYLIGYRGEDDKPGILICEKC